MADTCYLCNEEGSTEYPLVQCSWNDGEQCERLCCRLHHAPYDGSEYCLHHQGQMLLQSFQANMATIADLIANPPILRTDTIEHLAEDVEAHCLQVMTIMSDLGLGLNELHQNLIRGIRDGRLYA